MNSGMHRLPCPPELWPQFSKLLEQALELPAHAHEDWLAKLAGEHASLRPWLARCLRGAAAALTDDYLQGCVRVPRGVLDDTGFQSGQRIGPWTLQRSLGHGGMGEVWLAARSDGTYEREVALKLPHAHLLAGAVRRRFDRERDVLAALTHPNIASFYDAGLAADGQPYLALEFVDGLPITAHCTQERLDLRARIELMLQVSSAVQHAHGRLIVHRDLKPSNVLVTSAGQVKLLDFGIAKLLHAEPEASQLTRQGGGGATPAYAAPEQLSGETVTVATDTYALGVMLFELLTGHRPFEAQGARANFRSSGSDAPVEAPPASTRVDPQHAHTVADTHPRDLERALRGDLDAILAKALAPAPEDRYTSVEQLAEDLQRHLRSEPIRARRITPLQRAEKFVRRHRLAVGLGGALAAAIAVGVTSVIWQAQRAQAAAEQARASAAEAQRRTEQADGLLSFMLGDLRDRLEPLGRLDVLESVGDRALAYFAELDAADASTPSPSRAKALEQLGELRRLQGRTQDGIQLLQRAFAERQRIVEALPDKAALLGLAQSAEALGNKEAEAGQAGALAGHMQVLSVTVARLLEGWPDDPEVLNSAAGAHALIAYQAMKDGRHAEAETNYSAAIRADRALSGQSPAVRDYRTNLLSDMLFRAKVLQNGGRPGEAAAQWRESIALARAETARDPADAEFAQVLAIHLLGAALQRQQSGTQDAEPLLIEARQRLDKLMENEPSNDTTLAQIAFCTGLMAEVLWSRGQRVQASAQQDETVSFYRAILDRDPAITERRREYTNALTARAAMRLLAGDAAGATRDTEAATALWIGRTQDSRMYQGLVRARLLAWDLAIGRQEGHADLQRTAALSEFGEPLPGGTLAAYAAYLDGRVDDGDAALAAETLRPMDRDLVQRARARAAR